MLLSTGKPSRTESSRDSRLATEMQLHTQHTDAACRSMACISLATRALLRRRLSLLALLSILCTKNIAPSSAASRLSFLLRSDVYLLRESDVFRCCSSNTAPSRLICMRLNVVSSCLASRFGTHCRPEVVARLPPRILSCFHLPPASADAVSCLVSVSDNLLSSLDRTSWPLLLFEIYFHMASARTQ